MLTEVSTTFYDIMFGEDAKRSSMNLLERETLKNARKVLNSPDQLSKQIPLLPVILITLLDTLKDPKSTIDEFVAIIKQDPPFAAQILKVVNSPQFSREGKEVLSLHRAICILGLSGVSSIASKILMAKVIPSNGKYYKKFGKQIWTHSVQCASLSMMLFIFQNDKKENEQTDFDAYFLGLIHDLGKIIIFNCLCESLSLVTLNSEPNSQVFKKLMSEMSIDITYHIAVEWGLPHIYCEALREQSSIKTLPLAILLDKANQICEAYLMYERDLLNDEQISILLEKLEVKEQIWHEFKEIVPLIEANMS